VAAHKGNKTALGNKGGRPPMFETPEEMQAKIDAYFNGGANKRQVVTLNGILEVPALTMSGLAYFLGFTSRQGLYEYDNYDEFSDIFKKARLRIEMNYEERLAEGKPTGAIFALKNMGWEDRTKSELTGKDGKDLVPPARILSKDEIKDFISDLKNGY